MKITASTYDEARGLLEDQSLDADLRAELQAEVSAYETQKQVGGAAQQLGPGMASSVDAMEAGGMHRPMSREDWGRQYHLRKQDVSKDVKRQIDAGMTQAFVEDDPNDSVVSTAQPIAGQEAVFHEELKKEFPDDPEAVSKTIAAWGYKPEQGDVIMTDGDPTTASLRNIEEQAEADKLALGLDEVDETFPSASKRKSLYAPPEFMPKGIGFMDAATAGYFEEPPLELAKQALRQGPLGAAADSITEESDQYKRFADALWKSTYEEAEKAGRPVVRIKYMNTDDWVGKAAQYSAKALGKALPFASGIDKSLTGGAASTLLAGAIDEAAGGDIEKSSSVRRGMIESEKRNPLLTAGGAVVGALAPGGLVGRTYSKAATAVAPRGATGLRDVAGTIAGGFASGGVASVAPNVAQNAGELLFADKPRYVQLGDILSQGAESSVLGGALGPVGKLIGSVAGKGVKYLREGRRGKALADLEQAGMSTGGTFSGVRTDPLDEVRRLAAKDQRGFVENVIADDVVDGLSALSRKRMEQGGVHTSAAMGEADRPGILAFRSKPGQEAFDEALLSRAEDAGVAEELLLMPAIKSAEEIAEAARIRSVAGSKGTLSGYTGNIGEFLMTRFDPAFRALSLREPIPRGAAFHTEGTEAAVKAAEISEDLLNFIRNIAGSGVRKVNRAAKPPMLSADDAVMLPDPMNPIREIGRLRGRGSARQLSATATAGVTSGRKKYTINDLSYEEQQILARLVELIGERQLPAASGE